MRFRDFINQPNKKEGTIDPDVNIHYGNIPNPSHILFRRINLDGSLKQSYWDITFPGSYPGYHNYYTDNERNKLKIWAQNMPEYQDEEIHVYNIPRGTIRDLQS